MKIMKSLLAVSVLAAAAGQAFGACYNVSGSMTGINTVDATADPDLWVYAGSTTYNAVGPSIFPTFSSATFCIDTTTSPATVTGTFADFVQYSTSVKALIFGAVVNQPDAVYAFNTGTVTWTPVSAGSADGTLTLGQTLVMPNDATETAADNAQTSNGSLTFTGTPGTCTPNTTGATIICTGQSQFFLTYPNMEKFYLTLTISGSGASISGTAVGSDVGGTIVTTPPSSNRTGDTWYSYSFSGTRI